MAELRSKAMKTRALILLVCLGMTYPAHAQCRRHFLPSDPVCPVDEFLHKVFDLKTPYDPSNPTDITNYSSPTCNGTTLANSFLSQLSSAFALAPANVKQKLCKLDQVFVASSGSFRDAWGIWEIDPAAGSTTVTRRGNGRSYITIPDSVLTSATSLAAAEMALYAGLFNLPNYPSDLPQLSSQGAVANTAGAGTLAVLAHELGHILLADTNADGKGGHGRAHPRTTLCGLPKSDCFEHDFLGIPTEHRRWKSSNFHQNMRRWVPSNRSEDQHGNAHQGVDFGKIWRDVDRGLYPDASIGIANIYNGGELVSLL